jgi:hypothetical protein
MHPLSPMRMSLGGVTSGASDSYGFGFPSSSSIYHSGAMSPGTKAGYGGATSPRQASLSGSNGHGEFGFDPSSYRIGGSGTGAAGKLMA